MSDCPTFALYEYVINPKNSYGNQHNSVAYIYKEYA